MPRNVWLAQISTQYGQSLMLPYSVGMLQAYAQTIPDIREAYTFKGFLVGRERIPSVVARLDHPAVLGLSCYLWNWEYSMALALAVKQAYPQCLIVAGGPQVPDDASALLREHQTIDLAVHYEGEAAFAAILHEALQERPDFTQIDGLSIRMQTGEIAKTRDRQVLADLSTLPSPYLMGVFDHILRTPYDWQPIWEGTSARACPYQCSFCIWGQGPYKQWRTFPMERLLAEVEWFARHKIRLLYSADSNWGIVRDDLVLTEALVKAKEQYGYPQEFRAAYAKNSGERVFQIGKLLADAGMCKGVTLSFQSLDPHTLKNIKRSNIKIDDFAHWMRRYRESGVPTYTELILGLPGETYASFKTGIDQLLDAGQHEHINMYLCQVLPNSELADPAYRARYGLQTVCTPLLQQHATAMTDALQERHEIVIGTEAMPPPDWKRTYLFAWAVQTFHCMGLLRCVAMYLREAQGLPYSTFYECLLLWAQEHPETAIGQQYAAAVAVMERALAGGSWDVVIPEAGSIVWPSEEAAFLHLVRDLPMMYGECVAFLASLGEEWMAEGQCLRDVVRYQMAMVVQPLWGEDIPADDPWAADEAAYALTHVTTQLRYNWHAWMEGELRGQPVPLRQGQYTLTTPGVWEGSFGDYARHVVWYGRKSGTALHQGAKELRLDK